MKQIKDIKKNYPDFLFRFLQIQKNQVLYLQNMKKG